MSSKENTVPHISGYIDTHFHLYHSFQKGLSPENLLLEAFGSGMAFGLDISTGFDHLEERINWGDNFPNLYFSIGCYPSYAEGEVSADLEKKLTAQAQLSNRIIALGEIGLDYHWLYGTKERQKDLFSRQIALADKLDMPVIIHCREAQKDLLDVLKKETPKKCGIIHCFSGDYEFAASCLDLGFALSFAGNITYKSAHGLQDVIKKIPLNSLLLETDAPYLTPAPLRGKLNKPDLVRFIYARTAELRSISLEKLTDAIRQTTCRIFNVPL